MKHLIRLLSLISQHKKMVSLSILLGFATILSGIGLMGTAAYLISRAALQPSIAVLQVAIVGVRFFGISRGVFRYLERLSTHSVNLKILSNLRRRFFEALEPLIPSRSGDFQSGDLLSRVTADVDILEYFYIRVVSPVIIALLVTAGMGIFMGFIDPALAVILTSGLIVNGALVPLFSHFLARKKDTLVQTRGHLDSAWTENIQGMREVFAFNQQEMKIKQMVRLDHQYQDEQMRFVWRESLSESMSVFFPNLTMVIVLLASILLVYSGGIQGVLLATVTLVALSSFEAVQPLSTAAQNLELSQQAAERLFSMQSMPPEAPSLPHALMITPPLVLNIQQVSFTYEGRNQQVLNDISFSLSQNKRIALVGPSGAGKTTIINLLLRLWEIQTGTITCNGKDLRRYKPEDIRSLYAVVSQQGYIFNRTLRENLKIGDPASEDAEIVQAIEAVELGEWFRNLKYGLDTWLGEFGAGVSGGERQRILIARAILRSAPVWLLDEPTVHLDKENEQAIIRLLLNLSQGRSSIWIQHHLLNMEAMDEVLVLQAGEIVERGTHDALLNQGGLYAFLWHEQNQASLSSAGTFSRLYPS